VATNVSTSLTPAQRRRAVLDKKGVGSTRRLTTAAPNKVFWGILAVASLLTVFGLMMVLSATSIEAVNRGGVELLYRLKSGAFNEVCKCKPYTIFGSLTFKI